MNLSPSLNDALNQQVVHEYKNQLIYAQLESKFEDLQLTKIAKYFRERSAEEKTHADKFIAHINARTGGKVNIGEVPAPDLLISDVSGVGDLYVQTEEGTTESIESIYELAHEEKSYIDCPFLLEMLSEQVSEEDEANEFSLKAKNVKDLVLWDASFE
jgi:ferritin